MLNRCQIESRREIQIISIEDLVPENHILRIIDRAVNLDFIYDEVWGLYCADNGRPSVDPVVLFKIVLLQYTFGIRSMRQTIKEIKINMAYRWYLGYGMTEKIPHFSTFGKNYLRRFADNGIFEKIFEQILFEVVKCKFVDALKIKTVKRLSLSMFGINTWIWRRVTHRRVKKFILCGGRPSNGYLRMLRKSIL